MPSPVVSFAAALLIALVSTPLALRAALRFATLDHPDDCLKRQAGPVPTLGGLAIYAAVALSLLPWLADPVPGAVLLGGAVLVVSGWLDDLGRLSVTAKLAAQSVAALIALFAFDLRIELTPLEGVPALAIALSFVWLVGLSNAFNFLDVMDGLAAGTAAIAGLTLALIGIATGDAPLAAVAAALAGACAGFLRYNRPPARIYMGDAGSLFLGFALGALALRGRYTEQSPWGAFAPVLILGVPVLEVAFVTLMRWRKGISPLRGSPDHIAYRLEAIGLSTPSVLAVLWTATALSAAAGFALQSADADTAAWVALAWAGAALCAAIPLARIPIEARKAS